MTYYYGCFVTHYVHGLNLMKKKVQILWEGRLRPS